MLTKLIIQHNTYRAQFTNKNIQNFLFVRISLYIYIYILTLIEMYYIVVNKFINEYRRKV